MKVTILIFLLLFAERLHAQPYYFKHYQVENGLSHNSVFASVQDDKGFMWFGTKDGLNRFDGYSFKTYRHDPADPASLGNDKIYSLLSDKTAGLWVGTDLGLYKYNPEKETFSAVKETMQIGIRRIHIDKKGNLWLLSNSKVYCYNPKKKEFSQIRVEDSFDVGSIYCQSDGAVLITSPEGDIAMYHPGSKSFKTRYQVNKKGAVNIGWVSVFMETKDHQLLLGSSSQGIKLFDPKTNVLKDIITQNKDKTHIYVRDMQSRNEDEFWIGTESGLYIYNHRNGSISQQQKQYSNPYTLSDNAIYSVCRDRDGGMWIGTYFGGTNYYAPPSSVFSKYFPEQQRNSISGSDVREILKDKNGNFWIGTEDAGLNKLDPKTGRFTSFFPTGNKTTIAHSNVHGLVLDNNHLWIGTFEHGLDVMDINTGIVIKHYVPGKGNSLRSSFVLSMVKTRAGDILLATTVGLYKYNRKKDDFDAIPGIPFYFFNNILEDSEGNIWAGSYDKGLFRFRLGDNGYTNFVNEQGNKNSLSSNTINGIFEDSKKNIWIVTDGGGLSLLDKEKSTFKSYNANHGLPSNFLFRILEDHDHKLWISSTRGLFRFDPQTAEVKTYTRADGLLTDQFNYNSSYKDSDGRMYFGSLKGMVSFCPEQLNPTSKTAPVFLTGFQIDNTESTDPEASKILTKSVLYTNQITLKHNQSSFSIDFAGLSYASPATTEYAYKMTGLYNSWEYLKTNRKVYFTKLAPGTYVFEAKAMINGSTEWSKDNVKLRITIQPPFWKTSLAYALYSILFLGIVTAVILEYHKRTDLKNKRRMKLFEHQKEKEIYQAKIEFFTNVAHEIRTPLTLIKGPMEKIMKLSKEVPVIEKNLKTMNRNTDRLLNLTNQLLDFRKTEVQGYSLNFVKLNISELIEDIKMQFQDAAESKHISFETRLPSTPFFAYVDTEALYKIMSNLVDNAIKYGKSKVEIVLSVNPEEDKFSIQTINDGLKIAPEIKNKIFEPFYRSRETEMQRGTGIGLSISRSLAELHQGRLYLEESGPECNVFTAVFPIHQAMEFNLDGKWKKR
ncbi:ligand-binding sensor domain-containing protein [Pedobacter caeni]|uniref:histidine kinase n=1 Tax=Pedobacter caeni TaxID=288992 RepID=A0A1M5BF37_9SPHI|nr:sensor histidine kinase [Pedobacter caeni]SHF41060.1 Two component regulator propeller [Pedobacter caeni]